MLSEMVFRSEDLPAKDRLAALDALWVNSEHPMRAISDNPEGVQATARMLDLAAVNVVELALSPVEVVRTPKLIRQADPELCSVIIPLSGTLVVSQARRETMLKVHELALYDSSQPFSLRLGADGGTTRLVRVHIPRALLGAPAKRLERILATPLSGTTGFGGLLTQFLSSITARSTPYGPGDLPRLGALAHDLLTSVVAHHLDAANAVPDDSRRRTSLLRIKAFIQQHLHDPELTPSMIAAAHYISVSYLHRLFRDQGDGTVAAWIRRQRLEGARRDLAHPSLRATPIYLIAARWGYPRPADFTRAFRTAYDIPPNEYRHRTGRAQHAPLGP
ncbi:helix-turn-helix domain-containing protein [Streptomyces sp. YGL11-2]|uniref:AraC-like ligand-binding domain-containing protein n=1 Tax=Streptomyces sp. YGL11-2 TaxID=3414028 RepID=UPI003CFA0B28